MSAVPRVVVSAPSSGHGKTALAVGLLAAFAGRGLSAVGFKVGPDHTDAAYLGAAAGSPGRNLDPRLVGAHRVAPLFAHAAQGRDIAVVEGTMGLFDSLAGRVETDSTAGVAAALRAPVIMVVDVGAMGQSVAALVHGFRAYDELTWLGGVILNRVASDRHEQLLREALDDIGVPVYGALRRRDLPSTLPPRHEGVVPVLHREVEALRGIRRLGESVAGAVDLDGLLALAHSAPNLPATPWSPASELALAPGDTAAVLVGRRPVVALAGGQGLSFTYAETRELLEAAGATVIPVDPLRDELLPEGTDALVIGGALPEAYAEELSANRRLCADVADLARSGRPVVAEGAGLLWLAQSFDGRPMCGVLDATGSTGDQMIVGYRDATARATTAVAEVGARVVGYKQHRGVVNPRSGQTPAWTWNNGTPEGFVWRRVHASQLSLHWAGFPEIARRLVLAARPGDGPAPAGSWAQPTGPVPVVGGPRDEAGALDYGTSPAEGAPRLRAVPANAADAETTEAPSVSGPPRLRVVPAPTQSDGDPADARGFAGGEQVTDGYGFAGVPGARAGDGYAPAMPPGEPAPRPEAVEQRRAAEFGFPVGRGGGGEFPAGERPPAPDDGVGQSDRASAGGFGPGVAPVPASGVPAHGYAQAPFAPRSVASAGQPSGVPAHDVGGFDQRGGPDAVSSVPAYSGGFDEGGAAGSEWSGGGYRAGEATAPEWNAGGFGPGGPAASEWTGGGFGPPVSPGQPAPNAAVGGGHGPSAPGAHGQATPFAPPRGSNHGPAVAHGHDGPLPPHGPAVPGVHGHEGPFPTHAGNHGPSAPEAHAPFSPHVGSPSPDGPGTHGHDAPFPPRGDSHSPNGPGTHGHDGPFPSQGGNYGPGAHDAHGHDGPFPPRGGSHSPDGPGTHGPDAPFPPQGGNYGPGAHDGPFPPRGDNHSPDGPGTHGPDAPFPPQDGTYGPGAPGHDAPFRALPGESHQAGGPGTHGHNGPFPPQDGNYGPGAPGHDAPFRALPAESHHAGGPGTHGHDGPFPPHGGNYGPDAHGHDGPFPPHGGNHGPDAHGHDGPFPPHGGSYGPGGQPSGVQAPGHGGFGPAYDGGGQAGVPHQPAGAGGRPHDDGRPNSQWGVAPVTGGQPVPGGVDQTLSGLAAVDGALDGGTAEVPAVAVRRAPHPPRQAGGGRTRDDDGGIG